MGTGTGARLRAAAAVLAMLACATGLASATVDANTGTQAELDAINGIGPALAARIVAERRKAPFRSLEDLQARVRGVGEANLRRMRDSGLVVGPTRVPGGAETIVGGAPDAPSGGRSARAARP